MTAERVHAPEVRLHAGVQEPVRQLIRDLQGLLQRSPAAGSRPWLHCVCPRPRSAWASPTRSPSPRVSRSTASNASPASPSSPGTQPYLGEPVDALRLRAHRPGAPAEGHRPLRERQGAAHVAPVQLDLRLEAHQVGLVPGVARGVETAEGLLAVLQRPCPVALEPGAHGQVALGERGPAHVTGVAQQPQRRPVPALGLLVAPLVDRQ